MKDLYRFLNILYYNILFFLICLAELELKHHIFCILFLFQTLWDRCNTLSSNLLYRLLSLLSPEEKIKERKKLDYQKNKEKVKARSKIWKDNNKEKARQVADKNHKDRMKNDPGYRLLKICGGLVGNMLRSSGSSKNGKSSKYYFPFNKEELKASIQNKFQSWMTWDNQGIYRLKTWIDNDILSYLWNLDHWIPQNLLPYSSMEDKNFRIAWDLANLRPISAKQNILENHRKTIDKIYTAQEYKDLCILIELLKEIIDNPINKPELIIFYESMIKAKEDYEN